MHTYRLIIPLIVLPLLMIGCKGSQTSSGSTSAYSEDLTYLRPELSIAEDEKPSNTINAAENNVTGSINSTFKTELDSVNQKMIERNKAGYFVDGYTIQLYTGNDRNKADETKTLAETIDEDLKPVISYYQPTYKVRVGKYTSRLEAHMVYESLKEYFPRALLIPERIKINYE
ncbi:SPOR domain-containing protein [Marinoscillum sp. MHG1-6]|uniref:SPOR domain-containing protein n=1 Tax=Marinoscillum sp. MHG1-6 TaxID=2959627 RepID=UPI00215729BA|nr:SPOR domain-containing protein [Marinoscillum sp. MHG1-6]